jgi:hypothetical protein
MMNIKKKRNDNVLYFTATIQALGSTQPNQWKPGGSFPGGKAAGA